MGVWRETASASGLTTRSVRLRLAPVVPRPVRKTLIAPGEKATRGCDRQALACQKGRRQPSDGLAVVAFGRAPAGSVFGRNVARVVGEALGGEGTGAGAVSETPPAASFRRKTARTRSGSC